MATLSTLGAVHTAIGLVAVGAGILALARHKEISPRSSTGMFYIVTTVLTCVSGFFIYSRGHATAAHALGVLTLLVLGFAALVARAAWAGRHGRTLASLSYSLTLYLHFIPGVTETGIRFPAGDPLFSGHDDPVLAAIVGALFLVFLAGAGAQLRWLRVQRSAPSLA